MRPQADNPLAAAGIPVFLGVAGSGRAAVQQYLQGKLSLAQGLKVSGHW